jgi:hypothetical protein
MVQSMPLQFNTPNSGPRTGPDRIFHVPMDGGVIFARRGGKFVDKHGAYYRLATANSSNLAGFAEVEAWPRVGGTAHPVSGILMSTTGMTCPINMNLQMSGVLPCSNGIMNEGLLGSDRDIIVVGAITGNPVQCVDMSASAQGILRLSEMVDQAGKYVACTIPPDKRYGNL